METWQARRPKLLFLAWTFPPVPTIGAVRTWNVAKSLARLGWEVTVVTPDPRLIPRPDNPEKTRTALAAEGIRQIFTDHHLRFLDPSRLICRNQGLGWLVGGSFRRIASRLGISRGIGWIKAGERACAGLLPKDVDLILASGPPFAPFVLAERLSRKLRRPYVLDYRDPWWTEVTRMIRGLQPLIDRLERRLLAGSQAVTIVSPSWASDLNRRFKVSSKVHVITNGYDPDDLRDVKPHAFGHFAIVYAGIFYPPIRVVTPLLTALKRLAMNGMPREWRFHYYGGAGREVIAEAQHLGIEDHVKVHGTVPRADALAAVKGANLGVVIVSSLEQGSPEINGWVPAKLFETLGLGTPVLLIAPPGTDAESIGKPTGLLHRYTGQDTEGIARFIEKQMSSAPFEYPNPVKFDSLTWRALGERLDGVLRDQLLGIEMKAYAESK